jgi:hypothetical protein
LFTVAEDFRSRSFLKKIDFFVNTQNVQRFQKSDFFSLRAAAARQKKLAFFITRIDGPLSKLFKESSIPSAQHNYSKRKYSSVPPRQVSR